MANVTLGFNYNDFVKEHPEYEGMDGVKLGKALYEANPQQFANMPYRKFLGQFLLQDNIGDGKVESPQGIDKFMINAGKAATDVIEGVKQRTGASSLADQQKYSEEQDLFNSGDVSKGGLALAGQLLPYLAVPGSQGAAMSGLIGGGLAGATFTKPEDSTPAKVAQAAVISAVIPTVVQKAVGLGGAAATKTVSGLKKGASSVASAISGKLAPTSEKLGNDIADMMVNPEAALAAKKAADKIGMPLSAAEAGQQPNLRAQVLNNTDKEFIQQRFDNAVKQGKPVKELLEKISPAAANGGEQRPLSVTASELYKQAGTYKVPAKTIRKLSNNQSVAARIEQIIGDKDKRQLLGIPERPEVTPAVPGGKIVDASGRIINEAIDPNIAKQAAYKTRMQSVKQNPLFWSEVAKKLYTDSKPNALTNKPLDPTLRSASKFVKRQIDKITPEFKLARMTAQRDKARTVLEVMLSKPKNGTRPTKIGHTFANILQTPKQFDQIRGMLKNHPDLQQHLDTMKTAFQDVLPLPTGKKANNVDVPASMMGVKYNILQRMRNLVSGRYDAALVKATFDPVWAAKLSTILKNNGSKSGTPAEKASSQLAMTNKLTKLLQTIQASSHGD